MKNQHIATEIGSIIRKIRVAQNLSQEDLADRCELHRTYIGSLERAEKVASILTLERVAKALDVSLSEIFRQYEVNKNIKK